MKVIGIDPSNTVHAWAWLDAAKVLAWGRDFETEMHAINLVEDVETIICIEMVASYGMPVGRTVFDTCVQIGRLHEQIQQHIQVTKPMRMERPVFAITRKEVACCVCGSSRAKDSNIRRAVIDMLGGDNETKKGGQLYKVSKDVWAALAVALAWQSGEAQSYPAPWQTNLTERK